VDEYGEGGLVRGEREEMIVKLKEAKKKRF
jgi:hypothetical protein